MSAGHAPGHSKPEDGAQPLCIIGDGLIGSGVAFLAAAHAMPVRLIGQSGETLADARLAIADLLDRQMERGKLDPAARARAEDCLKYSADIKEAAGCPVVIEAVTENEEAKRAVYKTLTPHLAPETVIATTTSSISITRLAANTDRPSRFIGAHFMNPPHAMQLVELIRGIATDDATYEVTKGLVERLGKTAVAVEDFPAFIVNRVLLPMINEAIYTLYEGVGSVTAIDTAMRHGANHPMGPLELADFIGLDTCLSLMQVLYDGLADSKYRPCPLLVKYVEAGWLGRKAGRGFYDYSGDTPIPTR